MHIQYKDVSYAYGKRKRNLTSERRPHVLQHINVTFNPGEMVAIAGKSGSGKSTFLQLLKGFLSPSEGILLLDGTDPHTAKRPELFDRIGYIFQYPEHQLFAATVEDDVAFGLKHSGLSPEEKLIRVKNALDSVGLDYDTFARRSPFELSGGEKRRAAIAGVVALEPEALILDEPTAGLDLQSRRALFELLHRLNREHGITVIWVSHQLEEIVEHADRMLALKDGHFIADGPPLDLLSEQALLGAFGWEEPPALILRRLLAETNGIFCDTPWHIDEVAELIIRAGGATHIE